jgi:rRNA maturation endonuclease Nob1
MDKPASKSSPACSRCGSNAIVMKSRTSVGDSRTDDVIRTEMLGCAVIFKYLTCEACGQNVTRAEFENFQKGGTAP